MENRTTANPIIMDRVLGSLLLTERFWITSSPVMMLKELFMPFPAIKLLGWMATTGCLAYYQRWPPQSYHWILHSGEDFERSQWHFYHSDLQGHCSFFSKCITNLICERLNKVLPNIISHNQGAVFPGRSILHNVLFCQDIIKMYDHSHMKKLDLMNA